MLDEILKRGTNGDGIMFNQMGKPNSGLSDSWGYNYVTYLCYDMLQAEPRYREQMRSTLANLSKLEYRNYPWERQSIDGFADSIEGALYLINREPVAEAIDWTNREVAHNIVYADDPDKLWITDKLNSNGVRTALIHAMMHTRGTIARPWKQGMQLGASQTEDGLTIILSSPEAWSGTLVFDTPRHRSQMGFKRDWPRMNTMPEWFTVEADHRYLVQRGEDGTAATHSGEELAQGLKLELEAGQELQLHVSVRP
jgi:hypothetical protein